MCSISSCITELWWHRNNTKQNIASNLVLKKCWHQKWLCLQLTNVKLGGFPGLQVLFLNSLLWETKNRNDSTIWYSNVDGESRKRSYSFDIWQHILYISVCVYMYMYICYILMWVTLNRLYVCIYVYNNNN